MEVSRPQRPFLRQMSGLGAAALSLCVAGCGDQAVSPADVDAAFSGGATPTEAVTTPPTAPTHPPIVPAAPPACVPCATPTPHPMPTPCDDDGDGDGVPEPFDCDDTNALVGALLFEDDFAADVDYFNVGPKLTDPWAWSGGAVRNSQGGQQALLGAAEGWTGTVTFATLSAHGAETGCGAECSTDRYRAGILARMEIDADQDEGFSGYRCAVARNAETDCYQAGPFVQLAAFLDAPEDDVSSECAQGDCPPNPTFDELDREARSEETALLKGDEAELTFWAVGPSLVCAFEGVDGESVVTRATDHRFSSGGTGLSTLNALAAFDHVRVCQAFGTP